MLLDYELYQFPILQTGLEVAAIYQGLPQDLAEARAAYQDEGVWEKHKGIKASGDITFSQT